MYEIKNNKNIHFEYADQRPENNLCEVFDKLSHHLRDAYEHDSKTDITESRRLVKKLQELISEQLDSDISVKSFLATYAKDADDKMNSLLKLWVSMDFAFVDKDERWKQIGSAIKRHSLTNDVPDTT